ncbi:sensor histidine kinase [Lachnospiraceae bacterium OttesenSCG-928-D06]|nr:sensor histidine kinase [Lachnospiraceae bacterium OttesenSCG-928-D06]
MHLLRSLKMKIILVSAGCTILVGIFTSLFLYSYLVNIIADKADHIESMNMNRVVTQLNETLEFFCSLGSLISDDSNVAKALTYTELDTTEKKQTALYAQEVMRAYMSSYKISQYINRIIIFNSSDVTIQTQAQTFSQPGDAQAVQNLTIFPQVEEYINQGYRQVMTVSPSIENGADCLALFCPIYDNSAYMYRGWLYIEMNFGWMDDILRPYVGEDYIIAVGDKLYQPMVNTEELSSPNHLLDYEDGEVIKQNGSLMKIYRATLTAADKKTLSLDTMTLYRKADVTVLAGNGLPVFYSVAVVVITALLIAIMLSVILTNIITKPLNRLIIRLKQVSKNDLSFDSSIEQGGDEIAEIGKVVNEMTANIDDLMKKNEQMYLERQNVEIALLQNQIKPHFIYNTLDSIRWMASIQKNTGIENMARSLSHLLRNIAKDSDSIITLEQELALLNAYVAIQSIRYVETFRLDDQIPKEYYKKKIIKFTLQPLVENAIYHGIEPTGRCGTVTLKAFESEHFFYITVTDNGIGMSKEQLEQLYAASRTQDDKHQFSGIGISNVHKRLQLRYGYPCGLTWESEPGKTTVTVRLPGEE